MSKNFGSIELSELFGGYEIVNKPADKLPQDLASAIGNINSAILGATFLPIWYVGSQVVNGKNHFLICKEIRATKDKTTAIVGLIINIPAGKVGGEGDNIVEIIEEANLPSDVQLAFQAAEKQLVGVGYKPLAYIGKQIVRGVNLYIICQAKGIYQGANPYAVILCLNVFENTVSVVGVTPIPSKIEDTLCGYSFTW